MTDSEILEHAKSYIDKLANGINPLTDEPVEETDVINNVRISRCLFYVSGVLGNVLNGSISSQTKTKTTQGKSSKSNKDKKDFYVTKEQLKNYNIYERNVYMTEIIDNLNSLVNLEEYKKLPRSAIYDWLLNEGYLYLQDIKGAKYKRPTEKGYNLGIKTERRTGLHGDYTAVLYTPEAHRFIIDNIYNVLSFIGGNVIDTNFLYNEWNDAELNCLINLYSDQVEIPEIAERLDKKVQAVTSKLIEMGLLDDGEGCI